VGEGVKGSPPLPLSPPPPSATDADLEITATSRQEVFSLS
jgi:hypothetical protein